MTEAADIEDYIRHHIDPESDYLHALWRDTQLRTAYGQMASGHIQGRFLKMLVKLTRPHRVLELGTFSGYSALCMAEGLEDDAQLHTFEIFDEMEDFLRQRIDGSPYGHRVVLHIGDALQLLPQMQEEWDLAFIDADKRQYVDYYQLVLPQMKKGGLIVVDNTLWYGHVLDNHPRESDLQTRGVQQFNDLVAKDERVEKVILPLRDGLTLIRVK